MKILISVYLSLRGVWYSIKAYQSLWVNYSEVRLYYFKVYSTRLTLFLNKIFELIFSIQLNCFKYSYVRQIILFHHLIPVKYFPLLLFNISNSAYCYVLLKKGRNEEP